MNVLEASRIFLGAVFVLFAPGLAWSYVFFARKNIDWIERVALSFGLSVALVPISIFWLNWLFHMRITVLSASATVGGLIVLAVAYVSAKRSPWGRDVTSRLRGAFCRRNRKHDIEAKRSPACNISKKE